MEKFLGKKLLFLTAHPDDESYLAAGTIYKNYIKGGRNVLICSSLGEKGTVHLIKPLSERKLKVLRRKELLKAGRVLKISKIYYLNFPDGELKKFSREIYKKSLFLVAKEKPDFLVSFNTDGITGHVDHIQIGKVAILLSLKTKTPLIKFTLPVKFNKLANEFLKSRKLNKRYVSKLKYQKPVIKIKINQKIKKQALFCHRSQMTKNAFSGFPKYVSEELLKNEYLTN